MLYQRYMCVTLQRPLPSLYVFACKNGRVVAELWSSCAEYRASCAEYRASCGRVVRVLGELFGKIVEFGQLAQKRLGRHLCLGGGKTPIFLRHFDFFGLPRKVRTNHPSYPPRNGSETPCDPKIHAKGDSEYEKMQKNSEKVAF